MPSQTLSRFMPWTDRNGRPSWLRAVVFALLFVPAAILVGRALAQDLGPRPLVEAIHVSGDWAVRLLLLAIAVTPLRALSGDGKLIGLRRMIGVAALAYALIHVTLWAVDLGLDPAMMATEILVRPYLTLGFAAFTGLVALGLTSTDGAIRRLGAAWKRLHGLVHPIAVVALVHLFLQSKLDLAQGTILAGIAFGGLAIRVIAERDRRPGLAAVAIAGLVALLGGAASEAVWFWLKTGRSPWRILEANLSAAARIPPAWWGAAIVLAVGLAAVAWSRWKSRGTGAARREDRPRTAMPLRSTASA